VSLFELSGASRAGGRRSFVKSGAGVRVRIGTFDPFAAAQQDVGSSRGKLTSRARNFGTIDLGLFLVPRPPRPDIEI
jgi:hypothetical protein